MALHTKKDFAAIVGVELKDLYIYIKRKKVICTGEYINDTNEINMVFIEKRKKRLKKEVVAAENKSEMVVSEPESIVNYEPDKESDRQKLTYLQLEREKKIADLVKVEADTVYRQLQIDKLTGISVPTELVKSVISTLSKSFVSSFKDGYDELLIEISKKKTLTGAETAELRGTGVKIINNSIKKSVDQARKDMKKITDTYSEQREVGQHD